MITQRRNARAILILVLALQVKIVMSQQPASPLPKETANALAIRLEKGQNDREACIAVIEALNSDNESVRKATFERIAIHSKERRSSRGYKPPVLSIQQFGDLSEQLVSSVAKFLEDRSPTQRLIATKVLLDWQLGAKAAAPALEKAINDPDPEVRSSAICAFASCSADERQVTRVLLENIEDPNALIRNAAIRRLRDYYPATLETVPILAASLGSKNHAVSSTALFAIWKLKKHAGIAIPELRQIISKGSDPRNHVAAASALLHIVPDDLEAIDILVKALPEILLDRELMSGVEGYMGYEVCEQLGPRAAIAVPRLKMSYGGADGTPDHLALKVLMEMGATKVQLRPFEVLHLVELLESEDPDTRRIAAEALITHDPKSESAGKGVGMLLQDLKKATEDKPKIIYRLRHARARQEEIVSALIAELENSIASVRRQACIGLGGFPEESSAITSALLGKLKDASYEVRGCAAYSLLKLHPGNADSLAELNRIAFSDSAKVRTALLRFPRLDPKYQMPIVMHLLRDADPDIRRRAMEAYCDWEPAKAAVVPILIAELKAESEGHQLRAARSLSRCAPATPELVPALIEIIKKGDQVSGSEAAMVLGSLGSHAQTAIPALNLELQTQTLGRVTLATAIRNIQFPD